MTITTRRQHRCHGGIQGVYRHESSATQCAMKRRRPVPHQCAAMEVRTIPPDAFEPDAGGVLLGRSGNALGGCLRGAAPDR
jgi:hypothetical protein